VATRANVAATAYQLDVRGGNGGGNIVCDNVVSVRSLHCCVIRQHFNGVGAAGTSAVRYHSTTRTAARLRYIIRERAASALARLISRHHGGAAAAWRAGVGINIGESGK
jgi:hypothetical protein